MNWNFQEILTKDPSSAWGCDSSGNIFSCGLALRRTCRCTRFHRVKNANLRHPSAVMCWHGSYSQRILCYECFLILVNALQWTARKTRGLALNIARPRHKQRATETNSEPICPLSRALFTTERRSSLRQRVGFLENLFKHRLLSITSNFMKLHLDFNFITWRFIL